MASQRSQNRKAQESSKFKEFMMGSSSDSSEDLDISDTLTTTDHSAIKYKVEVMCGYIQINKKNNYLDCR